MDERRFDNLTRLMAIAPSRRRLAGSFFGVGLCVVRTMQLADSAVAKKRKKNKKKRKKCKGGTKRCGKKCVNVLTDRTHCGECGNECATDEQCCDGQCSKTDHDHLNCGRCGHACAGEETCENGLCQCSGGIVCGGECVIDGQCCETGDCESATCRGVACADHQCAYDDEPDGATCADGVCCGGHCRDIVNDSSHCGSCHTACAEGETCCSGECANVSSDPGHCGGCDEGCDQGEACSDGHCGVVCGAEGFCRSVDQNPDCCAGDCTNTDTDPEHCGACGNACAQGERCWDGKCVCGDVCDRGCRFASIQNAAAALQGGTVRICAGTYKENVGLPFDVTLIGAGDGPDGTVVDAEGVGNGLDTMYIFNYSHVELRGMRISGGYRRGVYVDFESNLTMKNCTVTGNGLGGNSNSGGLAANGNTIITNCAITDNHGQYGAGIYLWNGSTLAISDSVVTDNAGTGNGGGLDVAGGDATLSNCTIEGNAAVTGAGIQVGTWGTVSLIGTTVTHNTASSTGGGIFNDGGSVTLDGASSVEDNTPDNCVGTPACAI